MNRQKPMIVSSLKQIGKDSTIGLVGTDLMDPLHVKGTAYAAKKIGSITFIISIPAAA
ncbi:MAG TPA: hypothetical protein VMU10_12390 [Desulfomonilia bacterium]|nr:hypothetical protein [Desulfomonilia bacterium]